MAGSAYTPNAKGDVGWRLEKVADGVHWILDSPLFPEIRIDEQVRFNLLKDQVDEWLESARDKDLGRKIWTEIINFLDYLAELNNRTELAAFDRDLLVWTIQKVQNEGFSNRLLDHLHMLTGRDAVLDGMLVSSAGITEETWLAVLQRVLVDLETADVPF